MKLLSALPPAPEARGEVPSYALVVTCKQCNTRSAHKISKQGYHHGTVLVTCPGCKNRHLMADHLNIFSDERITLEDILEEKGGKLKRLTVSEGKLGDGDIELVEGS
jgi:protein import protein ZIM17